MPGILPMKVIKIGTQAQARIAQACDRCRSKKIRCDGIRPSCSQCVNVGFECKTSDKLSRRAFPRGYTESLEERVRSLETEVKELKALLDEKDENIDVLSRIHSNSSQHRQTQRKSFSASPAHPKVNEQEKDETFKVTQPLMLPENENLDAYFMGASSGRSFIDAFQNKLHGMGQSTLDTNSNAFFKVELDPDGVVQTKTVSFQAPTRLVTDQLINIFFQEWAPLYPILHRPTFLGLYEEYVACPEKMEDKKSLAQLYLVFSIAAYSRGPRFAQDVEAFDSQWQVALEYFLIGGSNASLQALLLAQIRCLQKADYTLLLKYKSLAISLSQRLGLHQSQKRSTLGTLTCETRKKMFWTLYSLDCFSAAQLGLPRSIRDEDAQCEYPVDADDEYVTEKGFLPTLPGEVTRMSSALALIKASRILAKVLIENYPSSTTYEISFRKLDALADELDQWQNSLPTHLKLNFVQDKPSTNVVSSRSPLLSLAYQYIRSLIYRPAVCASSTIGEQAGSATLALAGSSKRIVQILELLEERNLAFSIGLNKNELLVLSGFGLMFHGLAREGCAAINRNNWKLIESIGNILELSPSRASTEFRRTVHTLTFRSESPDQSWNRPMSRHNSEGNLNTAQDMLSSTQKHLRSIMSRFSSSKPPKPEQNNCRTALPALGLGKQRTQSETSLSSTNSEPILSPYIDCSSLHASKRNHSRSKTSAQCQMPNLDYLPLGTASAITSAYPYTKTTAGRGVTPTDWERLLSTIDNGQGGTNIYDSIYGGSQFTGSLTDISSPNKRNSNDAFAWSPDVWDDLSNQQCAHVPRSVLSFSDESLTSGEELPELSSSADAYRGILIPGTSPCNAEELGFDRNFGL